MTNADYLLAAGQTLSSVDLPAINVQVAADSFADVTIAGRLVETASPQSLPPGVLSFDLNGIVTSFTQSFVGGRIIVNAGGEVDVDATGSAHTVTAISDLASQEVLNFGAVHAVGDFRAVGISVNTQSAPGGPSQIENIGAVQVTSNHGDALGILLMNGSGGENTGSVRVTGATSAVGVQVQQVASFANSGEITAHSTNAGDNSIGLYVTFTNGLHPTVSNSGHVEGAVALRVVSSLFLPGSAAVATNSGQLVGEVDMTGWASSLTNTGTITGAINLSQQNDLYDNTHGQTSGLVSAGQGNDTELGGAGFDNLQGNQGDDSLSGGGGDDIVVGGKDNDAQFGGAGDDVVWGNLGNDTLDGGDGADQVRGGQGDDSIAGGAGNDYVSGDRGNDTETGGAGADTFHSFSGAGIDRVLDFNAGEGDRVMLDPGTSWTVSQVGADTVVDMGGGDQVVLVGVQMSTLPNGWIFTG